MPARHGGRGSYVLGFSAVRLGGALTCPLSSARRSATSTQTARIAITSGARTGVTALTSQTRAVRAEASRSATPVARSEPRSLIGGITHTVPLVTSGHCPLGLARAPGDTLALPLMHPHHREALARTTDHLLRDPELEGLLLVGSLAHGFADESSDVDIAIIVSEREHARRAEAGELTFFSRELAGYEGGYIDGKYLSLPFLEDVERRGSEPARYAFAHARVLASRVSGLPERLERIASYPVQEKAARIASFHAQLEAWSWYVTQAAAKQNDYLMITAVSKLVLYAGRLVLAHNELLYPYHKWFLRVLEQAPDKPAGLLEKMTELSRRPSLEGARELYELVNGFREWNAGGVRWPQRFLLDTELAWMRGVTPVDDT